MVQTVARAEIRGVSEGAVLGQGLHGRCCVWCRWPNSAENGGDSTGAVLDKVNMPVVIGLVPKAKTAQETVEIPQVQFLDLLFMPVVMPTPVKIHRCSFRTRILTCPFSTSRAHGDPDSVSRTRIC